MSYLCLYLGSLLRCPFDAFHCHGLRTGGDTRVLFFLFFLFGLGFFYNLLGYVTHANHYLFIPNHQCCI